MSTTLKFVLDKRRANKNGLFPVRLRIFQGRNFKDFTPNLNVPEFAWDDVSQKVKIDYPKAQEFNQSLDVHVSKLKRILKLAELEDRPDPSLSDLVIALSRLPDKENQMKLQPSFFDFGYGLAKEFLELGRVGNSTVYTTALNRLKGFVGSKPFTFTDLNYKLLSKWESAMLIDGMSINGIGHYMRTIRSIYNKGIKEGLVSIANYPFIPFKIKHEKTVSRTLTLQEFKLMKNLEIESSKAAAYRDLFLLSFCLIGINFSDLLTLKRTDLVDGRVVFHRRKTNKIYSIKIHPEASSIINRLQVYNCTFETEYLLPFLCFGLAPIELKKNIGLMISNVNDTLEKIADLSKINKKVTTYFARYSWANIAKKDCLFSKDMIAEALGHEYGNRVTGIYVDDFDNEVIDSMNAKVIDFVFAK